MSAVMAPDPYPWSPAVTGGASARSRPERQPIEPQLFSARSVLADEIDPPRWAVDGLFADGLSLLVGAPKVGKSWLALDLAVTVAAGGRLAGHWRAHRGPVLYLALEDGRRRLATRLRALLGAGGRAPSGLTFGTTWDRFGSDGWGLEDLADWVGRRRHSGSGAPRLVVIDTWAKVAPAVGFGGYSGDYDALGQLKRLADRTATPIVLVHHQRKTPAKGGDPLETVAGSVGMTGSADGIIILTRDRGTDEGRLYVTGRDVEEEAHAMAFNGTRWLRTGEAKTGDEE